MDCQSDNGPALNDLDDQHRLPLRRSPFDAVVHRHTHRYFPLYRMSRFSLGHYNTALGIPVTEAVG
jgi:hypothetical protein